MAPAALPVNEGQLSLDRPEAGAAGVWHSQPALPNVVASGKDHRSAHVELSLGWSYRLITANPLDSIGNVSRTFTSLIGREPGF